MVRRNRRQGGAGHLFAHSSLNTTPPLSDFSGKIKQLIANPWKSCKEFWLFSNSVYYVKQPVTGSLDLKSSTLST